MTVEYDFDLWKCLIVNTHEDKQVISTEQYNDILSLSDVFDGVRLGNYGMELALFVDTADECKLKSTISKILDV